ncbi:hypothetical protein LY78DRAFT_125930 [Colletotrichum sublineola]|nr:hypothetical protein LY78DRAFT_125930 [Colletotrichum sublineola]
MRKSQVYWSRRPQFHTRTLGCIQRPWVLAPPTGTLQRSRSEGFFFFQNRIFRVQGRGVVTVCSPSSRFHSLSHNPSHPFTVFCPSLFQVPGTRCRRRRRRRPSAFFRYPVRLFCLSLSHILFVP